MPRSRLPYRLKRLLEDQKRALEGPAKLPPETAADVAEHQKKANRMRRMDNMPPAQRLLLKESGRDIPGEEIGVAAGLDVDRAEQLIAKYGKIFERARANVAREGDMDAIEAWCKKLSGGK